MQESFDHSTTEKKRAIQEYTTDIQSSKKIIEGKIEKLAQTSLKQYFDTGGEASNAPLSKEVEYEKLNEQWRILTFLEKLKHQWLGEDQSIHLEIAKNERYDADTSPTVFLIHGIGINGSAWGHVASELSSYGAEVIMIDRPGYGLSDKNTAGSDIASEAMIIQKAIEEYCTLNKIPYEKIHIVGNSYGGNLAIEIAKNLQERQLPVGGVIAISSMSDYRSSFRNKVAQLKERFVKAKGSQKKYLPTTDYTTPWSQIAKKRAQQSASIDSENADLRMLTSTQLPDYTTYNLPNLVTIGGTADFFTPSTQTKELGEKASKENTHLEVEKAGHSLLYTMPFGLVEQLIQSIPGLKNTQAIIKNIESGVQEYVPIAQKMNKDIEKTPITLLDALSRLSSEAMAYFKNGAS